MWMFIFMILPLLAVVYIGWHVWAILPFTRLWKTVTVLLTASCFLLFFFGCGIESDSEVQSSMQAFSKEGKTAFECFLFHI